MGWKAAKCEGQLSLFVLHDEELLSIREQASEQQHVTVLAEHTQTTIDAEESTQQANSRCHRLSPLHWSTQQPHRLPVCTTHGLAS